MELGGSDCEMLRDGWLAQPVNALSSLAYIAAGAYVLRSRGPLAPAIALGAVGVGSLLYHGPTTPGAELVHDWSIVVLAGTLLYAGWRRSLSWPPPGALAAAALGLAIYPLTRTGAPLCDPESYLQGHAAYHTLTAIALALWLGSPRRVTRRAAKPSADGAANGEREVPQDDPG